MTKRQTYLSRDNNYSTKEGSVICPGSITGTRVLAFNLEIFLILFTPIYRMMLYTLTGLIVYHNSRRKHSVLKQSSLMNPRIYFLYCRLLTWKPNSESVQLLSGSAGSSTRDIWGYFAMPNIEDSDFSSASKMTSQKFSSITFLWSSVIILSPREDRSVDRKTLLSVNHAKIGTWERPDGQ